MLERSGDPAARQPLAPMIPPESRPGAVRSPKTAELVARTLRRMVVDGQLTDGDYLPHESALMEHFQVSRPTLREAVRVLESERLVEVRRGSRTGARVRVPGAEIVARPAGLLLELSGATLIDVIDTRIAFEPAAARLLAEHGTPEAKAELDRLINELPPEWDGRNLAHTTANLHRRMVELSGNPILAMIAGMLYEITVRHTITAIDQTPNSLSTNDYTRMVKSYHRLNVLVAASKGAEAEAHWRKHMEISTIALAKGHEFTKVRDIMD